MHNRPTYFYRRATSDDFDSIMLIMEQAKAHMRREGRTQWNESYPSANHILSDIEQGNGRVFVDNNDVMAYGAVVYTGEPVYDNLEGIWLSEQSYVVVHRLAVSDSYKGQGVAARFMKEIENEAVARDVHSFKVDTNFDNKYMLGILDRLGFSYCGKVHYEGGERLAYEKLI